MQYSKLLVVEDLTAGKPGIVEKKLLQVIAQNLKSGSCAASIIDELYKIWMGYIWHDTCERDVIENETPPQDTHTHTHTHTGRRVSIISIEHTLLPLRLLIPMHVKCT